jgi:hypothetical protein
MSRNRAANAPACPHRAQPRGSVVHGRAPASGRAGKDRPTSHPGQKPDFNPRTYDELVLRHANPLRRLYVIVCVIILEILQRMAMKDNPALQPLPSTVLARVLANDTFGLPPILAGTLRIVARELRRWIEPQAPREPAPQQASQMPSQPQPRPAASRARARNPRPRAMQGHARRRPGHRFLRRATPQFRGQFQTSTGPPGHLRAFSKPG